MRWCLISFPICLHYHLPKCCYAPVPSLHIHIAEPSWVSYHDLVTLYKIENWLALPLNSFRWYYILGWDYFFVVFKAFNDVFTRWHLDTSNNNEISTRQLCSLLYYQDNEGQWLTESKQNESIQISFEREKL